MFPGVRPGLVIAVAARERVSQWVLSAKYYCARAEGQELFNGRLAPCLLFSRQESVVRGLDHLPLASRLNCFW